jgi:hypothetical protein
MFIPDPDFYSSQITDPGSDINKRGGKKLVILSFFCSHKYHKVENYFILNRYRKKFEQIQWIQGSKRHRILDPDPQQFLKVRVKQAKSITV